MLYHNNRLVYPLETTDFGSATDSRSPPLIHTCTVSRNFGRAVSRSKGVQSARPSNAFVIGPLAGGRSLSRPLRDRQTLCRHTLTSHLSTIYTRAYVRHDIVLDSHPFIAHRSHDTTVEHAVAGTPNDTAAVVT